MINENIYTIPSITIDGVVHENVYARLGMVLFNSQELTGQVTLHISNDQSFQFKKVYKIPIEWNNTNPELAAITQLLQSVVAQELPTAQMAGQPAMRIMQPKPQVKKSFVTRTLESMKTFLK